MLSKVATMPCTNSYLFIVTNALLISLAQAATEPVTVDAAIEAAKLKKSSPAIAKPDVKNDALSSAVGMAKPLPIPAPVDTEPKLWSIKGLNNEFTAELIVKNKIYHVPLQENSTFDEWEILSYDSESITIRQKKPPAKALIKSKSKGDLSETKKLRLFASPQGRSILQFQIQQEGEINSLQRKAAANLPVNTQPSLGRN